MQQNPILDEAATAELAPGALQRDAGSTLTEILISIGLLATIVIALATAVQAMLTSSSTIFEAAQIETVLLNAGDQIDRAPQQCNYDTVVQAAALAEGWPSDAVTVNVEILVSNTGDESVDWVAQDCTSTVEAFDVQRLTIRAEHPTEQISRVLTVVKSNVA
ncbi:MAG: hypothetical protein AB8G14_02745 [Ilumatobacter sp.]